MGFDEYEGVRKDHREGDEKEVMEQSIKNSKLMIELESISNLLGINCYSIVPTKDKESLCLLDTHGFILGYDEMQTLIIGLQKFSENTTSEEIQKHNDLRYKEEFPKLFPGENMKQNKKSTPKRVLKPGYIYFILDHTGNCKIGKTIDIEKRLGEYTKLPYEPTVHHYLFTRDMDGCELYFHRRYNNKRLRGEWFDLDNQDLDYIKEGLYEKELDFKEFLGSRRRKNK